MIPAQQRLGPDDRPTLGFHNRLIVKLESTRRQRARGLALDEPSFLELCFHLRGKGDDETAGTPLGRAQRKLGTTHDVFAALAVGRRASETDADTELDRLIDPDR